MSTSDEAATPAEEYAQDCPKCGLTISTPTYLVQEKPAYNPAVGAFTTRVHIGPNDVEYQTHVNACNEGPRS